jgi:hypothetical protein
MLGNARQYWGFVEIRFIFPTGSAQSTSPFEKGGLRGIFGDCDTFTTENLPQSLFRKEGSALP